jgi:hypothetical protein
MLSSDLKAKQKAVEAQHQKSALVRVHRAISWLAGAEAHPDDLDAQFVFLWITFNAAYAQELGVESTERTRLLSFLSRIVDADQQGRLYKALFEKFSGPLRTLIDNKFVFEPFWKALREHDSSERWKEQFVASKQSALAAIASSNTLQVLNVVFDRLYVLRNQLVHGGATWSSSVNRSQLRDGVAMLRTLVPIIIDLMLDHPELDFGDINYPVV